MRSVEFESRINGIPCLIEARIIPGSPGNLYEPPEPDDVEFRVLDRRGRSADWLRRKLSREDTHRIKREAFDEYAALSSIH